MLSRHSEILKILDSEGSASIAALAERLDVSTETVRRDLRLLASDGTVLRRHGAAALAGRVAEAPFRARMRENAVAKQAIAARVAELVEDGDSLMLDCGTTTSFVARALTAHRGLTVVTNSTDAAQTLAAAGARVYLAGGEWHADSGAILGAAADRFIEGFRVRLAVVSAGALDTGGVMDFDPAEASIARAMLAAADRRIVASDSAKFGRRAPVMVGGWRAFDHLVADIPPPGDIAAALEPGKLILSE